MTHQRPAGDLHLIVEGEARRMDDEATLRRASGGPPYAVYEITPTKAFALPTDGESTTPTRWRFTRHG
jgi:hypothetical protein